MVNSLADYQDLWGIFPIDFDVIVERLKHENGNGVISGLDVSQHAPTPDMTVDVASGKVRVSGTILSVPATPSISVPAPVSNPRKDLIVVRNNAGIASVERRAGTEALADPPSEIRRRTVTPDPPDLLPGEVVLAEVYVTPGQTQVLNTDISGRHIPAQLHWNVRVANEFPGDFLNEKVENALKDGGNGTIVIVKKDGTPFTLGGPSPSIDIDPAPGALAGVDRDLVLWFQPGLTLIVPTNARGFLLNNVSRVRIYGNGLLIDGDNSSTSGVGLEIAASTGSSSEDCIVQDVRATEHDICFRLGFGTRRCILENCWTFHPADGPPPVRNRREGFVITNDATLVDTPNSYDNKLIKCQARNHDGNGFFIGAPRTLLVECVAEDCRERGFTFEDNFTEQNDPNVPANPANSRTSFWAAHSSAVACIAESCGFGRGASAPQGENSFTAFSVNASFVTIAGCVARNIGNRTTVDENGDSIGSNSGGAGFAIFGPIFTQPLQKNVLVNHHVTFVGCIARRCSDNGFDLHGDECQVIGGISEDSLDTGSYITGSGCTINGLQLRDNNQGAAVGAIGKAGIALYQSHAKDPVPHDSIVEGCVVRCDIAGDAEEYGIHVRANLDSERVVRTTLRGNLVIQRDTKVGIRNAGIDTLVMGNTIIGVKDLAGGGLRGDIGTNANWRALEHSASAPATLRAKLINNLYSSESGQANAWPTSLSNPSTGVLHIELQRNNFPTNAGTQRSKDTPPYTPNFAVLHPNAATLPTTGAPTRAEIDGTNLSYDVLDFPANANTSAFWVFALPQDWVERDIVFRIRWRPQSSVTTTNSVLWDIAVRGLVEGDPIDAALTARGNATVDDVLGTSPDRVHEFILTFSAANFDLEGGDVLIVKLTRLGANASDDLEENARLLQVTVELK